jgi:hypothetical protein
VPRGDIHLRQGSAALCHGGGHGGERQQRRRVCRRVDRSASALTCALRAACATSSGSRSPPSASTALLPEVREFITRHTAYNKHDTGWANKGAPSEDHTTPPSSRTARKRRPACWGGARRPQAPARFGFRGWLIPRVPYSGLVPYWEQTAVPATRPREGDVC